MMDQDALIERAKAITADTGMPFADAVIEAEAELNPPAEQQNEFTVTIRLRPRHAAFIHRAFGGHPDYTIEQRLAAYLERSIAKDSVYFKRQTRAATQEIGGATMPRSRFQEIAPR